MNYREALEYREDTVKYGSVPGLDTIKNLMSRFNHPQDSLRFIHIAGTNGKGSVSVYLDSILREAGYRTGIYNSPPVCEYREFARFNGKKISEVRYARYMEEISEAAEAMVAEGLPHPTAFEIETALAFLFFAQMRCDVVILETGMGGQEDATNIVQTTDLAILTSISMDHAEYLGHTLAAIAEQKAGIIKSGCRAVFMKPNTGDPRNNQSIINVITSACREKQVPFVMTQPEEAVQIEYSIQKQVFSYKEHENICISLPGTYQIDNAALVIDAVEQLRKIGYRITDDQLRRGFDHTIWPGRFDVVCTSPLMIVDGAHNEDAAKRLVESIELYFTNRKIIYIMGVLKDKEYEKICKITVQYASDIITVATPHNTRALPALSLAETVRHFHDRVTAADSVEEAVELALLLAEDPKGDQESVIIAFGSLSYLGEIYRIMRHKGQIRSDLHGRQRKD